MSFSPYLRRLAACTALAVSAGALLAAPAVAADGPALPEVRLGAGKQSARGAAYATAAAVRPRLDVDGDGVSDDLFRDVEGRVAVTLSGTGQQVDFNIQAVDMAEVFRDVLAAGNLGGTSAPELLTVSAWGVLSLYSADGPYGTTRRSWAGGGWNAYNKVIAPGDLTRDGRTDLLARTPAGDLFLYRATGALTGEPFASRVRVGGGWQAYDQLVGANDLDRDGIADLVARSLNGDLWFYKGTGSSSAPFKARVKVGPGWNAYNQLVGADDIDGDGRADLVARAFDGTLWSYRSTGSGTFAARAKYGTGGEALRFLAGHGSVPDYGRHSVLASAAGGELYEYGELANGRFRPRTDAGYPGGWSGRPVFASGLDTRDDAHLLKLSSGTVRNLDTDLPVTGTWTGARLLVGPGDLTGDGKGDLLTRDGSGVLSLHAGDGKGLAVSAPVAVGPGWSGYDRIFGAGDVTGDGRADLFARDTGGRLYLYPGTGSAGAPFAARVLIGPGWGAYGEFAATGDLNGDGRADLVARDAAGDVWRYTGTGQAGTAALSSRTRIATGWGGYTYLA
ncbi:FG-GAP repeat domain-containing protein [Streptomyces sp. NPDC086023]|uniref:FG-GAP repeat domain-containing protein n=1 Tax=Streptomyces sp. NPDC086023 TaxID=3365746 RepID=UPI0037CE9A2B